MTPRTPSSDKGSSSSNSRARFSTVSKSPIRRPPSICFTRLSRIRGISFARHSSFHCSNCTAPGTSNPSRNGPRISVSETSSRATSTSRAWQMITSAWALMAVLPRPRSDQSRMSFVMAFVSLAEPFSRFFKWCHQVVAGELPSRFNGEPDQQGEMLARAEADLLAGLGEKQGSAQREELQVRRQRDGSRRFGMVLLGTKINLVSTRCV